MSDSFSNPSDLSDFSNQAEQSEELQVKVIKSSRRTKTVSARMENDVMVIRAPKHISDEELNAMIEDFKKRFERKEKRARLDDDDLDKRAQQLNQLYFDGQLTWNSMTWSTRQNSRYGSCTPANKTIRISHQLEKVPRFVLDYVIVHELAHLLEANHGQGFWDLVYRYPKTERARGYLMAMGLEELSIE